MLEKQLISLKKQEQMFNYKYINLLKEKEKLKSSNTDMKKAIRDLEKEVKKFHLSNNSELELDKYMNEIEELKLKISKYDSERKDLLKSLNEQSQAAKNLQKKVYELENNLEQEEEDIDPNATMGLRHSLNPKQGSISSLNPNKTFNMSGVNRIEDKDEKIIALQNKIISFNKQHMTEIQELEQEKNREIQKIALEKEEEIEGYVIKLKNIEREFESAQE